MKRRRVEPIYTNTYQQLRNRSRRFRIIVLVLTLLIIIGGWFGYQHYRKQQMSNFPVRGVSLTQDNGFVDFQQLQHQGYQFAYLRATSGATYTDDQFQSNYDRSQGTNLEMGVYHVYSYTTTAVAQYQNFVQEVGKRSGQLPLAIQISTYGDYSTTYLQRPAPQKRLARLISLLKQHYNKRIIIWTTPEIWRSLAHSSIAKNGSWLQTASIKSQNTQTRFIEYDSNATVKLNGQSQTVAASVFNGGQRRWNAWVTQ